MSSNGTNSDGTNSKTQSANFKSDGTLGSANDSGQASSISPSDSSASSAHSLPPGNSINFGVQRIVGGSDQQTNLRESSTSINNPAASVVAGKEMELVNEMLIEILSHPDQQSQEYKNQLNECLNLVGRMITAKQLRLNLQNQNFQFNQNQYAMNNFNVQPNALMLNYMMAQQNQQALQSDRLQHAMLPQAYPPPTGSFLQSNFSQRHPMPIRPPLQPQFTQVPPPFHYNSQHANDATMTDLYTQQQHQQQIAAEAVASSGQMHPCRVCNGDGEGNGNHYGAWTCRPCGAFFRQVVLDGLKYTCQNNCLIDQTQPWPRCHYCRYQKCLALGMDPSKVGERSRNRKNETDESAENQLLRAELQEVQNLRAETISAFKTSFFLAIEQSAGIEESAGIEHLSAFVGHFDYKNRVKETKSNNAEHLKPIEDLQTLLELISTFLSNISTFERIISDVQDKATLLINGMIPFMILRSIYAPGEKELYAKLFPTEPAHERLKHFRDAFSKDKIELEEWALLSALMFAQPSAIFLSAERRDTVETLSSLLAQAYLSQANQQPQRYSDSQSGEPSTSTKETTNFGQRLTTAQQLFAAFNSLTVLRSIFSELLC